MPGQLIRTAVTLPITILRGIVDAGADTVEVGPQPGEPLPPDLLAEVLHPAEVGVDGHRRRPNGLGQAAGGQRLRAVGQEPRG